MADKLLGYNWQSQDTFKKAHFYGNVMEGIVTNQIKIERPDKYIWIDRKTFQSFEQPIRVDTE